MNNLNPNFKKYLVNVTQSKDCKKIELIQSLWSGYGEIARYKLYDSSSETVVVKCIALNQSNLHPRGWDTEFSHQRKVESYRVETQWYEAWNHHCDDKCRTPHFLGSFAEGAYQWIILEDLNAQFPLRKNEINLAEIKACLTWLAHFHARFLHQKPMGLWDIGTYWHLDTRPDELKRIEHSEMKMKAQAIDNILNQCKYQTLVHGDAKLANFCFSANGEHIAAVDFQYVGGGCGMKDVAYFLGSCLSSQELFEFEEALLDHYFASFKEALNASTDIQNYKEIEDEWRNMYPIACVDFTRFLLGWMPTHQKVNEYNLTKMDAVLAKL